jgi:uncharacterized protein (DUF885 family)
MRHHLASLILAFGLAALSAADAADTVAPLSARLAAQNALFEEQYQSDLKAHPERATAYGDYRYNDQLDDYSLAAIAYDHATDEAFLARLTAIPTTGFTEQDKLSHDLLVRTLQQRNADYGFRDYEMPVSQMSGPHVGLADLPLAVPLDSVRHYEDYIARLHQIPRVLAQTMQVMRAGMKDGLMPVRFLLEKVPVQCQGVIAADPFLLPLKKFPPDMPAADQQRLTQQITDTVNDEVLPAYKDFAAFVSTEYAPHGRTKLAVTALPDGERRYRNDIVSRTTISDLTPDQIHQLGLKEMERIQAEMLAIAHQQGFADLASFRASIKVNPKYKPNSADQILDDFRRYIGQMQPKLPELFTYIPGKPVTVEAIPEFQAAMATHYQTGTPDGKRPGRVSVATSNFAERSLVDDEATAYHEGIPGHHMQLSVAQQLTACPRSASIRSTQAISKAGRSMPSSSARRSASTRTRSAISAACRASCSAPCGSSSIPASTLRAGPATRWWISSARVARSTNRQSRPKPTAISPGPPRRSPTSWASSSSVNCASAPRRNWVPSSTSAPSTTKC